MSGDYGSEYSGNAAFREGRQVKFESLANGITTFVKIIAFPIWVPLAVIKQLMLYWTAEAIDADHLENVSQHYKDSES